MISNPFGKRNRRPSPASLSIFSFLACSSTLFAEPTEPDSNTIDLVTLGKATFETLGCAECHSDIKNDTAVKTGPTLYGLFHKNSRDREVILSKNQKRHLLKADLAYLNKSLRDAPVELAIAESGPTKGETYLPIMPPYADNVISDFKVRAIYQYLLTLNDPEHQGPASLMEKNQDNEPRLDVDSDPGEILVTDTTRIYRARLSGSSARAVYVGTPSGLNYSFDPQNLSIGRIWWGGFLNFSEELNGRGKKMSALGHQADEIKTSGPLLVPNHPVTNRPIDLSFKSPTAADIKTFGVHLYGKTEFADQLANSGGDFLGYTRPASSQGHPVFQYQCGKNILQQTFSCNLDGKAHIEIRGTLKSEQKFTLAESLLNSASISYGSLNGNIWSLPSGEQISARLSFTLRSATNIWRPKTKSSRAMGQAQVAQERAKSSVQLPKGYQAEIISPPLDPNGRPQLFEPLGIDQLADGSLIVSTRTAGVWRYRTGEWIQIAEGLLDAMGVIVEDSQGHRIVVGQKGEVTRLIDQDKDGVMDVYETLCDDFLLTENYSEYLHGPTKGADGNYYINLNLGERYGDNIYKAKGRWMGTQGALRGWSLQITPDGKMTPFASGLRSPAGLATSPDGHIYYTENQGEFVGTSKIFHLRKGVFYGHPSSLVDLPGMNPDSQEIAWNKVEKTKETSTIILPHSRLANSPGNPAWDITGGAFGPFTGQMFLGDQTKSNLFRVIVNPMSAGLEASMIPFASKFPSGVMRLLFSSDGTLYVGQTGRGWRSHGGNLDGLIRIKRTSEELENQLLKILRRDDDFTFVFTKKIAKIPKPNEIRIRSWGYLDSAEYGSKEMNSIHGKIKSISVSSDKKSFTITLKNLPRIKKREARVFHFISKQLPLNRGHFFEAFYSISKK